MIGGCSYVGIKVPPDTKGVCDISSQCLREYNDISISYKVTKEDDEYEVIGEGLLRGYTIYINASFTLLLIKDNIIVESVPIMSGSESSNQIPFGRKFKAKDFDETLIVCRIGGAG